MIEEEEVEGVEGSRREDGGKEEMLRGVTPPSRGLER